MKTASTCKKKVKKPATSAKILVTGLSATAVLGMASGYALAGKAPAPEITNTNITSDNTVATSDQQQAQSTVTAPSNTVAPVVTSPITVAPEVTNPPVVQVPVPQATPATPGNSNSGWQQQQSSGSR